MVDVTEFGHVMQIVIVSSTAGNGFSATIVPRGCKDMGN